MNMHESDDSAPLTVIRLVVDSFKRMRAANLTPNATGMVPVRGKNTHGKSALIESMMAALLGRDGKADLPITEGEEGATVILDLGEIVIKRRWTRGSDGKAKTALTVETAEGKPVKGAQAVLDALLGEFADPVSFLGKTAAEQVKIVLAILGVDVELNRLEQDAQAWYEKRRDLGRDSARLGKTVETLAQEIEGLPPAPEGATMAELIEQLKDIKNRNAATEAKKQNVEIALQRGTVTAERIDEVEEAIEELTKDLDVLQGVRIRQVKEWKKVRAEAKGLEIESTEEVEIQITAHEHAAKSNARREVYRETLSDFTDADDAHTHANDKLADVRLQICELLNGAVFPVDGMDYSTETKELTINGIPFGNASQAERLRAAALIAMAGAPRIRILFIREGSLLDEDNLALLAGMVEEWGGQLWCEIVDSTREGSGIWVEDGEAFESKPARTLDDDIAEL